MSLGQKHGCGINIHWGASCKNLRTITFMYFVCKAVNVCQKGLGKEFLHLLRARNMQGIGQLLITQSKQGSDGAADEVVNVLPQG